MHAIQIRNFGPPLEVLEHIELPEPSAPASDQVLLGVEFAPMNDLYLIEGVFLPLPHHRRIASCARFGRHGGVVPDQIAPATLGTRRPGKDPQAPDPGV
jgi:hypothetical protein